MQTSFFSPTLALLGNYNKTKFFLPSSLPKKNPGTRPYHRVQVVEVRDEMVEIDAFKITLLFIYSGYKNVEMTGEAALSVLYICILFHRYFHLLFVCFKFNFNSSDEIYDQATGIILPRLFVGKSQRRECLYNFPILHRLRLRFTTIG